MQLKESQRKFCFGNCKQGLFGAVSELLAQLLIEGHKAWVFIPNTLDSLCCGFLLTSLHRSQPRKSIEYQECVLRAKWTELFKGHFFIHRLFPLGWLKGTAFWPEGREKLLFIKLNHSLGLAALKSSLIKNFSLGCCGSHCFRRAQGKTNLGFCHMGDQIMMTFAWFYSCIALNNFCGLMFRFFESEIWYQASSAFISSHAEVT